jgi:hypothetical protein
LKLEDIFFWLTIPKSKKKQSITFQNPLTESEVPSNKIEVVLYRYWLTTNKAIMWAMARFYDRFFRNAPETIKIGLSFF